jgi:hypothetical protein
MIRPNPYLGSQWRAIRRENGTGLYFGRRLGYTLERRTLVCLPISESELQLADYLE